MGDGPLRHEIQAQANRFGIGARVHFVGDRMDASRLYAGFDVSVLASLHEGFPNAVLEAMAAGVAVVATAVGGVTELIQDGSTGYLVAPANAEALAQRITFALGDEEGRAAIAARGREFVKRFSMGKMVKAVETLYDELYTARKSERNCLPALGSPVVQAFQPDRAPPRKSQSVRLESLTCKEETGTPVILG